MGGGYEKSDAGGAGFRRLLARAPKDLVKTLDDEILRLVASRKNGEPGPRRVRGGGPEEGRGPVGRFE